MASPLIPVCLRKSHMQQPTTPPPKKNTQTNKQKEKKKKRKFNITPNGEKFYQLTYWDKI